MIEITDNTLMWDISSRFTHPVGELTVKDCFDRICEAQTYMPGFPGFVDYADFKRYLQIVEDNRNRDLGPITKDSRIVPIFKEACTRAFLYCAELTVEEFYNNPPCSDWFEWVLLVVTDGRQGVSRTGLKMPFDRFLQLLSDYNTMRLTDENNK